MLRAAPVFALLLVAAVVCRAAGPAPHPPCGGPAEPRFAAVGASPNVVVWQRSDLSADWRLPDCLGWPALRPHLVVALAAEFSHAGTIDGLLDRIGALSAYKAIPYWSASRGSWQPLTSDARLLTGPAGPPAGHDLHSADFKAGQSFAFAAQGYAGRTVYGLTVRQRDETRAVLTIENLSAIRLLLLPLFDTSALRSAIILERVDGQRWRYYQLLVADDGAADVALSVPASYANRVRGYYAYVAGQPAQAAPSASSATR